MEGMNCLIRYLGYRATTYGLRFRILEWKEKGVIKCLLAEPIDPSILKRVTCSKLEAQPATTAVVSSSELHSLFQKDFSKKFV